MKANNGNREASAYWINLIKETVHRNITKLHRIKLCIGLRFILTQLFKLNWLFTQNLKTRTVSNLENGAAKQCGQMLHSGKIADKSHHKQTLFYGGIPNPRPDKGKQAFETASGIFNGRRKKNCKNNSSERVANVHTCCLSTSIIAREAMQWNVTINLT